MKGLYAILIKDIRLLLNGTGIFAFFLPLILLLALQVGGQDFTTKTYIQPFPIAIRDEDDTIMSRSLISQIEEVALFSEVIRLSEEETDAAVLESGCAAIITIPKDFFYDIYRMEQEPVFIVLNESMPLETELLSSIISSVMEIIGYEQAAYRVIYNFCYGELTIQERENMFEASGKQLMIDALGRQSVFLQEMDFRDISDTLLRDFFSCALSLICLFFAFAAIRSLPEEISSGILSRYTAASGKRSLFFVSKYIITIFSAIPSMCLLLLFFTPQHWWMVVLLWLILISHAFCLLLCIVAWTRDSQNAQRWSNIIILISLLLGGAIYARESLPDIAQILGKYTIPYYAKMGLLWIDNDISVLDFLKKLFPIAGMSVLFFVIAMYGFIHTVKEKSKKVTMLNYEPKTSKTPPSHNIIYRIVLLSFYKLKALSGGVRSCILLLTIIGLCGFFVSYTLSKSEPDQLHLAIVLETNDKLAESLVEELKHTEGISIQLSDEAESKKLLESGNIEGILTIGKGYNNALYYDNMIPLSYQGAEFSFSTQATREIIASEVMVQKICIRALTNIEDVLQMTLTETQQIEILEDIKHEREQAQPIYIFNKEDGIQIQPEDNFVPQQMGFVLLAVMLTLFTWGTWIANTDARKVELRMMTLLKGRCISYASDILSLYLLGFLVGVCGMLPKGMCTILDWICLLAYIWCITGMILALLRQTVYSSRIDILSPFLALITCLLGGCFGNTRQISSFLHVISFFTPQGLALYAKMGNIFALLILFIVGTIFALLGAPIWNKLES